MRCGGKTRHAHIVVRLPRKDGTVEICADGSLPRLTPTILGGDWIPMAEVYRQREWNLPEVINDYAIFQPDIEDTDKASEVPDGKDESRSDEPQQGGFGSVRRLGGLPDRKIFAGPGEMFRCAQFQFLLLLLLRSLGAGTQK